MTKRTILLLTVLCVTPLAGADIWQDLATYKYGDKTADNVEVPDALDKMVVEAKPSEIPAIEKKLIGLVQSSEASAVGKRYACRMLQRIGTKASVPALAGLLGDKVLSHYARLALEQMTAIPEAGAALRKALDGAPDGVKPGIVSSLGERRDAEAVAQIAKLLAGSDPDITATAMMALGKIGGKAAFEALRQAKVIQRLEPAHQEAMIVCAATLTPASAAYEALRGVYQATDSDVHRLAAVREMVVADAAKAAPAVVGLIQGKPGYLRGGALRLVVTARGAALTAGLVKALGTLDAPTRAHVVELLGKRGDKSALPAVVAQMKSADDAVRTAAIAAVGELGGPAEIPALLAQAKAGGVGAKALDALAAMAAEGIDAALIARLTDKALRTEAVAALARRGSKAAGPMVLKLVSDPDAAVRMSAWESMGQLAGESEVPGLMKIVVGIQDAKELSAAQNAIRWICSEASDRDKVFKAVAAQYDQGNDAIKLMILELGPSAGTNEALALERAALKSGTKEQKDKALRALGSWPNPAAAPDLLKIAQGGEGTEKVLALRGYIQVAGTGGSDADKAKRYQAAAALAQRADDKRLLISKLRDCRHVESFRIAKQFLDDPDVKAEAEIAAIDVAHRFRWAANRKEIEGVLTSIAENTKKKGTAKRARDCLNRFAQKK